MKQSVKTHRLLITLLSLGCLMAASHAVAAPIAKLTGARGDVAVISFNDRGLVTVTQPGMLLNDGDQVQTGQGTAIVTFNDGAVVEVKPFSSSKIQEYEETTGFWPFKSQKSVRRITVFVGKLFFKSGASKVSNYLQTPTAVCALRGSEGEIAYDTLKTYLDMAAADIETLSKDVVQGAIGEILDAYKQSSVYQSLLTAIGSGSAGDILEALYISLETLQNNPDLSDAAKQVLADAQLKIAEELGRETATATTFSTTSSTTSTTTTTTSSTTTTSTVGPTSTTSTTSTTTTARPSTTTTTSTSTSTTTTTTTTEPSTTTSTTEHEPTTSTTMSPEYPNGEYGGYIEDDDTFWSVNTSRGSSALGGSAVR